LVIGCLVAVVALVIAEENWRGKHAWERYKRELEARGELLSLAALAPPPVPDDQNFAMTPLLKPLFSKAGDYAQQLAKRLASADIIEDRSCPSIGNWPIGRVADTEAWNDYLRATNAVQRLDDVRPELEEVSSACRRPYSCFPIQYESGIHAPLLHLNTLRKLTRIYAARAHLALLRGQTDDAAADTETIFRLAGSLKGEPLLVSQLTRMAILQLGFDPAWEGLVRHQWSYAQLAMFQSELQRMDFLLSGLRTLQGERAELNDTLERAIVDPRELLGFLVGEDEGGRVVAVAASTLLMLRCSLYQNLVTANRFYENQLFPVFNLAEHRVDPRRADSSDRQLEATHRTPYNIFAATLVSVEPKACLHFARTQVAVDEAVIACGLERYRLAHGQFPERLDTLVPQFITKLPNDVMNGQPLKYRRTGDSEFVLYSVGWNQTDDGGEFALLKGEESSGRDFKDGDWVWFSQPQPSASERK
jgi:hypothetical protein